MEIVKQLLFVWAIWGFLDKVHSVHVNTTTPSPETKLSKSGLSRNVDFIFVGIAGGQKAILGSWPWMVALLYQDSEKPSSEMAFECGGSLITRQWVITAAHCIRHNNDKLFARLGTLSLQNYQKNDDSIKTIQVDRIERHPKYSWVWKFNDIALLHLKEPVNFTGHIRPISLLSGKKYMSKEYYEGKTAYVIGWGASRSDGEVSPLLQQASITILPLEKCIQEYKKEIPTDSINENVLCGNGPGKDTCKGDSGGPLMFFNTAERHFYLGGITSWGLNCTIPNFPGIYAKVASHIPWINCITGEHF